MATMDVKRAYAECARITRREARNFYYAFLRLPRRQRKAVYALYAFCREADDVADLGCSPEGESEPRACLQHRSAKVEREEAEKKREGLSLLRSRLARAAAGEPQAGRDLALADTIARFGVEVGDLDEVITGVETDLAVSCFETFEELRTYCYRVAAAVGLAALPILNDAAPPTDAMREYAVSLGIGMQLVNILRDVAEDLLRDRIYFPQEELASFGVDEALLRDRQMGVPLRRLFAFQADRACRLLDRGRRLLPLLPRRGRACVWLLTEIYLRLVARIEARGYDVFGERVSLPSREKLLLLAFSLWRTR
jgi:phytoene synthase